MKITMDRSILWDQINLCDKASHNAPTAKERDLFDDLASVLATIYASNKNGETVEIQVIED